MMAMKSRQMIGALQVGTLVLGAAAGTWPVLGQVQDDFNDGNDSGWLHYDLTATLNSFGVPGIFADYTFPADPQGGKAYGIRAFAPPMKDAGPGRAFSYQDTTYSRVLVTVDLLDWTSSPNPAFGILFRAQDVGIGTTVGYVYNYNAANLDLQINRIAYEAEAGTIAEIHVPLAPATQNYRMVLSTYGPNLLGQLFQLPDLENPIASVAATDDTTADGKVGLFNFDRDTALASPGQSVVVTDTRFDNFTVQVPAQGSLKAVAVTLTPAPGGLVRSTTPAIQYAVLDRETTVNPDAFQLALDGTTVPQDSLQITNEVIMPNNLTPFAGATLSHVPSKPLASGLHTVIASYADNAGARVTNRWTFTVETLDGPAGPGGDQGFNVRVVQGTQEAGLGNSLARAEAQLAPNSTIPKLYDTNVTASVINYSQKAIDPGLNDGTFADDSPIPGQTAGGGTDYWAMMVTCWLDLPAGPVILGVECDDGYRVTCSALPGVNKIVAEHDGGPANETTELYVSKAGLYPFALLWYENTGGAFVEWFSLNASGERVLFNAPDGIQAYRTLAAPTVLSATHVTGPYAADSSATVDATLKQITTPVSGSTRFYRLSSSGASKIKTISIQGANAVITYE